MRIPHGGGIAAVVRHLKIERSIVGILALLIGLLPLIMELFKLLKKVENKDKLRPREREKLAKLLSAFEGVRMEAQDRMGIEPE